LVEIIGFAVRVEFPIAATFRARRAFAVTVRTFYLGDVNDTIQRFFRFLFLKNLHLIEKPQWISGAIAVADEPLVKARVARVRTSLGEDVPVAEASWAVVFLDATAVTARTKCSEATRGTTFTAHIVKWRKR
jgi:hypothetical protein